MQLDNREELEREVRETARKFAGRAVLPELDQKIGEDLGITDDDFYMFIDHLGNASGIDLRGRLEIRPPRKVNPWSPVSLVKALSHPGLIEDPTLERIVDLLAARPEA